MIVKEFFMQRTDGVKLFRTYSDLNMMIKQHPTEILYNEAIDVETAPYYYEETDIPIEEPEEIIEEEIIEEIPNEEE